MGLLGRSALISCALLACSGDSPAPPEACFNCGPSAGVLGGIGIVIENRTDHGVPLTTRELTGGIAIDRGILDGSFAVPIGPATRGVDRGMSLHTTATMVIAAQVQVLDGKNILTTTGGVFGIGGGPFFLAVGNGTVVVRSRDGADVVEAEDPRAVTLLPVDRDMPACSEAAVGAMLADPPSPIKQGYRMSVTSVSRDANGCRLLGLESSALDVEYRLCLPDAAFPFTDADIGSLEAMSFDDGGMLVTNGVGTVIHLLAVRFQAQATQTVADIAVAFSENPTCANIDPACGDVEIPAKLRVSFDGKTVQTLAVGESVVDPGDAERTLFLVGARFRAATAPTCPSRSEPVVPTEMFLAMVTKPVPGP